VAVGGRLDLYAASQFVAESAGYMFELASIMMLPVVIVLLLTNVTVGVVTRSAPTLNLFSFGFPITLLVCFLALYLATKPLGYSMEYLVRFAIDFIASFFGKLKNG
jgi:flagellar biosynthetic protein FliR